MAHSKMLRGTDREDGVEGGRAGKDGAWPSILLPPVPLPSDLFPFLLHILDLYPLQPQDRPLLFSQELL